MKIEERMRNGCFTLLDFILVALEVIANQEICEKLSAILNRIKPIYIAKEDLEGQKQPLTSDKLKKGVVSSPSREKNQDKVTKIFLPSELLPC